MSYCPNCARWGLRRRVKRRNRIKRKGIWQHKKCPNEIAVWIEPNDNNPGYYIVGVINSKALQEG